MMRSVFLAIPFAYALTACGETTTAPRALRYNFGVVDGANQVSTAGVPTLGQPITSQLTRHEQGKFARLQRIILPPFAYAQGLVMPGIPVAGAIVCAREADPGEPKAFPLCAFTDVNGKAPITIQGGTKAGAFRVLFTAQVQSQQPVRDSTTVTVEAGPITFNFFTLCGSLTGGPVPTWTVDNIPNGQPLVRDQFGNRVPYKLVVTGDVATVQGDTLGTLAARTLVKVKEGTATVSVVSKTATIATLPLTVSSNLMVMETQRCL